MTKRLLIILLLLPSLVSGTVYYVDHRISDCSNYYPNTRSCGSGSYQAYNTIQESISIVNTGDTVIVREGEYQISNAITIDTSGVTYKAYQDEMPVIDRGLNSKDSYAFYAIAVHIVADGIRFEGFEIKNAGYGIFVCDATTGCNDGTKSVNNVIVRNCKVHNTNQQGIIAYSDNSVIEGCEVYECCECNFVEDCRSKPPNNEYHWWPNALLLRLSSSGTVRGNLVHDNYGEGIDISGSTNSIVEDNIAYNNKKCQLYVDGSNHITVRNNLVYGTSDTKWYRGNGPAPGIILSNEKDKPTSGGNHEVYGNLVANTQENFGIWKQLGPPVHDNKIFNNIFVDSYRTDGTQINVALGHWGDSNNNEFRNNIILQPSGDGTQITVRGSSNVFSNNLWLYNPGSPAYSATTDVIEDAKLKKTIGWNDLSAGELDGSEFVIQSGSDAIDKGTDLGPPYNEDFFGTPRPQPPEGAWDIGAFEYLSGSQTCQSLGYSCCDPPCQSGPHTVYDGDCPGAQVCCDVCQTGSEDLVAHWEFDEGTGTTAVDSAGSNNGVISEATYTTGKIGSYALNFDGNGDYIQVSDGDSLDFEGAGESFTVSAWIYPNTLSSQRAIVYKADSDDDFWRVHQWNDNKITCSLDTIDFNSATGVFTVNDWYHVVCVFDKDGYGRVYINGQTSGSPVALNNEVLNIANQNLYIGQSSFTGYEFEYDGSIDDVRVYNYALSASEIQQLFNPCTESWTCTPWSAWSACVGGQQSRTRTCTDDNECGTTIDKPSETETRSCGTGELVGHWTFDDQDISGGQALDKSGNGHHGTIEGATLLTGRIGEALSFNGNGNHVNIGLNKIGPDIHGASGATVSAWVRIDSYPGASARERIFSAMMAGGTTGVSLNLFNGGNLEAGGRSVSTDSFQTARTSFPELGAWHLVTGIFDYSNDEIKLYIDGTLETSQSVTFTNAAYSQAAPASDDTIGANQFGDDDFIDGVIDDVRIYNKALSAGEIADLFNAVPIHPADTDPPFGCIDTGELFAFIDLWKLNQATIEEVMEAIGIWKDGC